MKVYILLIFALLIATGVTRKHHKRQEALDQLEMKIEDVNPNKKVAMSEDKPAEEPKKDAPAAVAAGGDPAKKKPSKKAAAKAAPTDLVERFLQY